jgi:hypothetical protein
LQKQVEGQFHLSFKGELIRGKTFYASPPLKGDQFVRLNYHLRVQDPDRTNISAVIGDLKTLTDGLVARSKRGTVNVPKASASSLKSILAILEKHRGSSKPRPEVMIEVLMTYMNPLVENPEAPVATDLSDALDDEGLDSGDLAPSAEDVFEPVGEAFALQEYPHAMLSDDLNEINRAAGLNEEEAEQSARASEISVNEALRRNFAPPLPSGKEAASVGADMRIMLDNLVKKE